ncbi:MAG: flavodoxin-dependent (E)-4-hydroxy-3-methylbut-2-enyl-diphosphate synthase [Peptoniphilaceae bacterium]|uniref:flavodoxin-dependent (E)-4-hydroxy-3-methylbut-2-enyl-diphosphate synthase n=1 Tax=Parvimonas sp. TaxID=1944660 RepID=UPI0025DF36F5|nr:flavodoxin-dependent (E)-4-hydroxy-3-methylbut-2-enyl-diphosphate synthase [Parvimonas sp.]MCI5997785.1 flavodoxin-dependent (E)-4-hydroxy-3-methylbut-2-enyl-diphosphate synthase [Parvimonas sp.]MDD7765290.1 flavodoxin-dependent (E)-4-hydroxy-3-methylbut-2-enyl-diphosphate synthase [Peptoniphilaceae bacterium]MDY3050902.1 flavodoxin-dependent (E)-4-hydroxy-3-methylbut-2-enyl-diphosphate synthase [Parvimonas sp.]
MERKITKKIYVGNVPIGGGSPISIQSMTNTITKDIFSTVNQINEFTKEGCNISRSAVNDFDDAVAIKRIKELTTIPFIADIQYDYKLAIMAGDNGADCLRINPGNIGGKKKVREVVECCKYHNIPIRIGVNSGSVNQKFIDKFGGVNKESIVYSALEQVEFLESLNFDNIKISIKSSNVPICVESYELLSSLCDYPLHLGITEAGPNFRGSIKSSVGLGIILAKGIGDTIRVSLTSNPVEEVKVGKEILRSLGLYRNGIDLISCPTCSRTKIDLIPIVEQAEKELKNIDKNLKIAIMGCPVNGPGEAKEADIGIAGGNGKGLIFKKGKIVKKVEEKDLLKELIKEINDYVEE